ncbi:hypothetical protein U91I_02473 [alpha proteobacterium U9-1i]|nr:hypothetical protein U91I_02473 [alpha proteobacterium U9-1i]
MSTEQKRGGAAAMLFLFCLAAGGAGLAFDLTAQPARNFWFVAEPGIAAVVGLAAAVFAVTAGFLARLALVRNEAEETRDV